MYKQLHKIIYNHYLLTILRLFLGGIFIFSGLMKLTEPREEFIEVLYKFDLLPQFMIVPFATILPFVELIGGGLTVLGIYTSLGLIIIAGMIVMFMGAIFINMFRGIDLLDCGCFGSLKIFGESSQEVINRDSVMLLINVWLLYIQAKKEDWLRFFSKRNKLKKERS